MRWVVATRFFNFMYISITLLWDWNLRYTYVTDYFINFWGLTTCTSWAVQFCTLCCITSYYLNTLHCVASACHWCTLPQRWLLCPEPDEQPGQSRCHTTYDQLTASHTEPALDDCTLPAPHSDWAVTGIIIVHTCQCLHVHVLTV